MKAQKRKFRSILSLVMTFALCLSMAAPAFAAAGLEPSQTNSQPAREENLTQTDDTQPSGELEQTPVDTQNPGELDSIPGDTPNNLKSEEDSNIMPASANNPLEGTYWVVHPTLTFDGREQLIGPGNGDVAGKSDPWLWEIEDKNDNLNYKACVAYTFTPITGESAYYWECLTDKNTVLQAGADAGAAVKLVAKDMSNSAQKWTITKKTDGTYTLQNGSLYVGLKELTSGHCAVVMSSTEIAWNLKQIVPQISLTLSSNRIALDSGNTTVTATVSGSDSNFNELTDVSAATIESSNPNIASVSGMTITALQEGSTTITAKLTVEGKEYSATAELEVVDTIESPTLDGMYFITGTGAAKGQCLEPGGDSINADNNLWFWPHNVQSSRVWVFKDAGSGYVYWQPLTNTSLYMIPNGSTIDFSSSSSGNTKWEVIPTGTADQYKLYNEGTGLFVKEVASNKDGILTSDPSEAAVLNFADHTNTIIFTTTTLAFANQEIKNAATPINPNFTVILNSTDTSIATVNGTTITALASGTVTITAQIDGDPSTQVTQNFTVLDAPQGWEGLFRIDGGDGIGGIFEPSGNSGTGNIRVDNELYVWSNSLANYRTYRFSDAGNGYVRWHFDYNPNIVIADAGNDSVLQKALDVNDDAQLWKLTPVAGQTDTYMIQSKAGSYIATAGDSGNAKIILSSDNSLKSVNWKITALKSELILTVSSKTIAPGNTTKADVKATTSFGEAITDAPITVTSSNGSIVKLADETSDSITFSDSVTITNKKIGQLVIRGESVGTADITATMTYEGVTYTTKVTVTVDADAPLFNGDEWYKGITVPEINREPSHADFFPYQDAATAAAAEKSALDSVDEKSSSYYQLLSQKNWDFAMVKTPAEAETADVAGWLEEILPSDQDSEFVSEFVPAEWQSYRNADNTFKYDEPVYTNSYYPWASIKGNGSPNYADPQAPVNYNPVGYYRTTFQTPADWNGRNIFISFQGVKSAYYVYVNGNPVGYSTDSFTAHDFNITSYLNPAGQSNTLAVKVFRFSIGSYLENQDMIHGSGIIRDVFLYSKDAKAEIRDFFVQTKFDDRTSVDSDVTMTVDVDVRNLTDTAITDSYTVDVSLKTLEGTTLGSTILTYRGLKALEGATGATDSTKKAYDGEKKINLGDRQVATIKVTNPDKWFPDTPNLYMLTLELKDSTGKVVEATAQRVGFREIYKVNINSDGQEQMQITGQKLIFRGVNRHDTDPINGHAVSVQNIIDDLKLMKQYNVNAVRTSHYPNNRILYALADELGLYIYAEANVESHMGGYDNAGANSAIPGSDARWVWPVMDRNMNMVELLKNHASIIGWSYSNESTYTQIQWTNDYCFWATAQAVLNRDPSRLRMYEREDHNYYHPYNKPNNSDDPWSYDVRKLNIIDVHATQYPSASGVNNWVSNVNNKLPYFQQEYEHAMGQSFGSFTEFWNLNRTKPNAQGGFIWDWMDQSRVTTKTVNGKTTTFWGYGGDWIDTVTNADAFCGNGVIYADRTPSSRAIQMRYDHQQVNFYPVDDSGNTKSDYVVTDKTLKFKVVNEYENTDLSAFNITWKLLADTEELGSGTLSLSTAPMTRTPAVSDFSVDFSSDIVTITLPDVTPEAGVNYLLNFSVENKNRPDWNTTNWTYDNVVAYDQFDLTPTGEEAVERTPLNLDAMNAFTNVEDGADTLKVSGTTDGGKTFSFQMDKTTGIISDYKIGSNTVLEKGPVPSFWRAMTYNDTPTNYSSDLRNVSDVMSLTTAPVITKDADNKHIKVELNLDFSTTPKMDATQTMTYDIYSNGEIVVSSSFTPNSNFAPGGAGQWALPKVGLRMTVAPGYENLEYLGRGPDETYIDRKTASLVGLYKSTVTEQFVEQYMKPQENGNRTDVRWTSLTNAQGEGLMVVANGTVETSALHVKAENINLSTDSRPYNDSTYRHSTDVPMDEETYWCIDAIQRGVSNTGFFNHIPLPGFYPTTTDTPTYSETFRIVPVDSGTDKMEVARLGFTASNFYSITAASSDYGTVNVDKVFALAGETVTITATPAEGYILTSLTVTKTGDSSVTVPVSDNTFVMPDYDVTVSATFIAVDSPVKLYTITVASADNGTVSVNKTSAQAGETITVTATPAEGYMLSSLTVTKTDDSSVTVQVSDNTFVMPDYDVTISAVFRAVEESPYYTITVPSVNNGTVKVDKTSAQAGETVTITTTPTNGYTLSSLTVTKTGDSSIIVPLSGNTFIMPDFEVTITATFTASSSNPEPSYSPSQPTTVPRPSGGGSSSSQNSRPTNTSTTVSVPVSNRENTIQVSAVVSGSTATVSKIEASQMENMVVNHERSSMVEMDFTGLGATINTVNLPTDAVSEIAKAAQSESSHITGLTLELSSGEISFDGDALTAIQQQAGEQMTLTIAPAQTSDLNNRQKDVVGDAPVFEMTLKSGNKAITDFKNGYATISLPYTLKAGQEPDQITVYYLDDDGNIHACETTYDVRTKTVIFTTNHLSMYFVGIAWVNPFTDISTGKWYYNAVSFVHANGLMGGYGNGSFGPDHQLTRAQLTQILYNKEDQPAIDGTSVFTDVIDGAWYTKAIVWAAEKGIVNGYGNDQFGPNDNITREQLAVMLWRYAGSPKAEDQKLDFTDASDVSSYALNALRWAVQEGIVNGYDNGQLDPQGLATRAQTAQMFQNFLAR